MQRYTYGPCFGSAMACAEYPMVMMVTQAVHGRLADWIIVILVNDFVIPIRVDVIAVALEGS